MKQKKIICYPFKLIVDGDLRTVHCKEDRVPFNTQLSGSDPQLNKRAGSLQPDSTTLDAGTSTPTVRTVSDSKIEILNSNRLPIYVDELNEIIP